MKVLKTVLTLLAILIGYLFLLSLVIYGIYEYSFRNKVYPGVFVAGTHVGNWTEKEVSAYFDNQNARFSQTQFEFSFNEKKWATDGAKLHWGYNGKKTAIKAFLIGRDRDFISNLKTKWSAFGKGIFLEPEYNFDESSLYLFLKNIASEIDIPPEEALFEFKEGKVTAFKLSKDGRKLNLEKTTKMVREKLKKEPSMVEITLPVEVAKPKVTTEEANNLGIKELIGSGVSYFKDSIPPRVYNISLATSRVHGLLIKKGEIFSFNKAVGKIASETGYQKAYIIKQGKTILDDGGGVCQVSTTLYRAALYSGLPIVYREAHTYRVSFYEPPVGLDATVFNPEPDLKFKNDTPGAILIQGYMNYQNQSLTFEFYGTSDGRKTTITQPVFVSQTPPPEPIYQDDPTLPKGEIKQVDTAHWGAKVYFKRKVERNGEVLIDETVWSNYVPWAAVYLRGTKE